MGIGSLLFREVRDAADLSRAFLGALVAVLQFVVRNLVSAMIYQNNNSSLYMVLFLDS